MRSYFACFGIKEEGHWEAWCEAAAAAVPNVSLDALLDRLDVLILAAGYATVNVQVRLFPSRLCICSYAYRLEAAASLESAPLGHNYAYIQSVLKSLARRIVRQSKVFEQA